MGGHGRPLESAASRLKAVVSRISCFTELRPCVGAQVPRGGPPWRPAAPRGPKYWFLTPSGCESISHRFSHLFPNAPKRCRSPPLSALDPLLYPFMINSLRFYCFFQTRARRLFWGPRVPTETFVVELGPFQESKRGPKTATGRAQIEEQSIRRELRASSWPPVQFQKTL